MICEICKRPHAALNWVSGASGTTLVCQDCAEPLRQELRERIARLELCETSDSLLAELLAAAIDVTHADMGNVQLVDEHDVLRIRAQVGFGQEFLDFFRGVEEHEAACGTAAASRRTVIVSDVESSPIFAGTQALEIVRRAGVRSVQSTPMFAPTGELIGVVSTHFREIHAFAYHELDRVGHLAAHASYLLEQLIPLHKAGT